MWVPLSFQSLEWNLEVQSLASSRLPPLSCSGRGSEEVINLGEMLISSDKLIERLIYSLDVISFPVLYFPAQQAAVREMEGKVVRVGQSGDRRSPNYPASSSGCAHPTRP